MSRDLKNSAILLVSDTDWSGMMLQKQQWAIRFAALGHEVCYVNKTPQRRIRLDDLSRLPDLLRGRGISPGHIANARPAPEGVEVCNLCLLPPNRIFAAWNRKSIERFAQRLQSRWKRVCLITYTPTPAILHLNQVLRPWLSAYVCVHNYQGIKDIPDSVIDAERQLVDKVSVVFCDARYLAGKWSTYLGRPVQRLLPACDPERFRKAWRGTELDSPQVVGFFGSSHSELDLPAYRAVLNAGFQLKFIAPFNPSVARYLGPGVEWIPPVPNEELPSALENVDVLMLIYRQSERNKGVFPGKFFECLATGKPIFISPLPDMVDYVDCVNIVKSNDDIAPLLSDLKRDPIASAFERRFQLAQASSWESRFDHLKRTLFDATLPSGYKNG